MRVLAKAPACPIHVEHADQNSLEELSVIIRGKATIADIGDDIAVVYDPDAEKMHKAFNCTINDLKLYGKVAFIKYSNHSIREFHYKQDKVLKEKFPNVWRG